MRKNKTRELILTISYFVLLLIILFNFGIHAYRTMKFNRKERVISGNKVNDKDQCSFDIHFRGGDSDSWFLKDVKVNDEICTLKGSTYDGVFNNGSECEISDWTLRIDILDSCYLNNCWCGAVEVHQKDKVQTVDLRTLDRTKINVENITVQENFMIPLEKGDYIIYHPSAEFDELPIRGFNGLPGNVTIGFIFYTDESKTFNPSNYSVNFKFKKGYMQGTEPKIFVVAISIWFIVLLIRIAVHISFESAYKKAEIETERQLNLQRMEDMKAYNSKLNAEVKNKTAHIREIQQKVVVGLANVIGNRDADTGGHVNRTSDIIKIVVEEYRRQHPGVIDDEKADDIYRAAPMHDLGKIYIDSSILNKPAKLTDEEFAQMKKHSENSGDIVKLILKDVEEPHFVQTAFNVARHHHERWDGKGYPDKLAGENIPLEARLMAIADVYDALVSRRCYKQPMSFDKAFDIMCEGMGSQFDPQMKEIFIACREKLEGYYNENDR